MTWQEARYADARQLRKWLMETYPGSVLVPTRDQHPSVARALRRWQYDKRAEFLSVDRMLTQLGLHVSQVPDDVWLG